MVPEIPIRLPWLPPQPTTTHRVRPRTCAKHVSQPYPRARKQPAHSLRREPQLRQQRVPTRPLPRRFLQPHTRHLFRPGHTEREQRIA